MAAKVYDILKGSFLTNDDAFKNWKFILFAAALSLLMIYTGHSFEQKVHRMAQLSDEVSSLHSEYSDGQRELMFLEMESVVAKNIQETGIKPPAHPPLKIIVKSTTPPE
jgi:hypothetical protein